MSNIIGTANFVSFGHACKYYKDYGDTPDDVRKKIAAGEIFIGEPDSLLEGQRIGVKSGRYIIFEGSTPKEKKQRFSLAF
jgi:hypothetical protein